MGKNTSSVDKGTARFAADEKTGTAFKLAADRREDIEAAIIKATISTHVLNIKLKVFNLKKGDKLC